MRCSRCTYQNQDPSLFDAHVTTNHSSEPIQAHVRIQEVDVLPSAIAPCLVYHRPARSYKCWDGAQWMNVDL
jgi:hypothetical protein